MIKKRKSDYAKENGTLRFTIPLTIKESDTKKGTVIVGGTLMKVGQSRNGMNYSQKNIEENHGKKTKFFLEEHGELEVKNIVGHVEFIAEGDELKYQGQLKNTHEHPDTVQHAVDKDIDVSLDARYGSRSYNSENDGYDVEGLDIRAVCGVGVGGIEANSMDFAIAESFKMYDELKEKDNKTKKTKEDDTMSEEKDNLVKEKDDEITKLKASLKEKDEVLEKVKEKEVKEKEEAHKNLVAEAFKIQTERKSEILKFKESELLEKDDSEISMIIEYEKKLKEAENPEGEKEKPEEGKPAEDKPDEKKPAEGAGEVIDKPKDKPEAEVEGGITEKEIKKNMIFEKAKGDIRMTESLRKSLYNEARAKYF